MIEIIPAMDIINGQCVRLTQGDFSTKTVYAQNPLEVALKFEQAGFKRLHLVDLDGARSGKPVNLHILRAIAEQTSLVIDYGGGIKSNQAIRMAFDSGAQMITAGSVAVKDPELVFQWLHRYGPERIILGADVFGKHIAVSGWQEITSIEWADFLAQYRQTGIYKLICTDIAKDGKLTGPSVSLYKEIKKRFPEYQLIASGGVHSAQDIHTLNDAGIDGVIIGKALYEGKIKLKELEKFLC